MIRTLALAEELSARSCECRLATRPESLGMLRAMRKGHPPAIVLDDDEAASLRRTLPGGCDLLLIDHYERGLEFERCLRDWAGTIAVVDDGARRKHLCDVLIDQNVGHTAAMYQDLVPDGAKLLLGTKYASIRGEFRQVRSKETSCHARSSRAAVIVLMGFSDPDNVTSLVINALAGLGDVIDLRVVLGDSAPHAASAAALLSRLLPRAEFLVSPDHIAALMAGSDLAISAAGSTALELATLGTPMILIEAADNQKTVAHELGSKGAAISLGRWQDLSPSSISRTVEDLIADPGRRQSLSLRASALCDGLGAERAADALVKLLTQRQ